MKEKLLDLPFEKDEKMVAEKTLDKSEEDFSFEEKTTIKNLLGTDEQIYKKVKDVLEALERKQAGSYEIGTSGFYNSIIETGGRKITSGEFNLCKSVIDEYIELVTVRKELDGEIKKHHDSLSDEEAKKNRKELDEKDLALYGGEEYINK
ncbi:MAG: hypothetical protein Q7T50_02350 [Candidatus Magasanikbacteria bacterium]|nr:hypothetical protein [Candidatus Magasanikbacteria bacterium]